MHMHLQIYKYKSLLLLGIVVLMLSGCSPEKVLDDFNFDQGYEYIPLEEGLQSTFRVDSILFKIESGGLQKDTITYRFDETITDYYIDAAGDTNYVVHRKVTHWDNLEDITSINYVLKRLEGSFIRTENNRSIIPLVFPPKLNTSWNGLSFFEADSIVIFIKNEPLRLYKDWGNFRITSISDTFDFRGVEIQNILNVVQADMENAIERRYSIEKYAKNLGLVYREMWILDTQNITDAPWEEKAERGYILIQQRI